MDGTILVADDDRTIRTVLSQALTRAGCKVRSTGSAATLWRWIEEGEGNVVVTDVMMPDGNGLDLLPSIVRKRPNLPVIVISAQNTVITTIKASEAGAYDYLPKPFDLKELLSKVNKALSSANPSKPMMSPQGEDVPDAPMIGSSSVMQDVYRLLARVINTDLNVLISGESGTGKDLLAKSLHDLGHRSRKSFQSVIASGVTSDRLESEVWERSPNGSTLYLDEVGEMSSETQLTLLEILQDQRLREKDIRFVSSTRHSLVELVNDGSFREDLFYRLNVIPIVLPPLRDRLDDIADLVRHFLLKASETGIGLKTIDTKAIDLMRGHSWFGNVRELENFIQRMAILSSEDEISTSFIANALEELPSAEGNRDFVHGEKLSSAVEAHIKRYFELHGDALPPPGLYNRILKEVELPLLALTLSATRGNQIKASELLGINRNTLRKKIASLDIQVTRTKKMM
jgi:two-component system nitrogen regulation response regulator GlnG